MKAHSAHLSRSPLPLALLVLALALVGCDSRRGQTLDMIPTVASVESAATAQALTAVAPPEGFRDAIAFPEIDANLNLLAGGRYVVLLQFDGVFSRTPRPTTAQTRAEVSFTQVNSSRRVLVETTGELLGREGSIFEAVRLGPDAFFVRNGQCTSGGADAETAAGLRAGTLIGGVNLATPAGRKAIINGEEVWAYTFGAENLLLPTIRLVDDTSTFALESAELWVAPARNAVVRFYVNLNLTNALIFDRSLPVDGELNLRYDLYDAGQPFNITVPNGC